MPSQRTVHIDSQLPVDAAVDALELACAAASISFEVTERSPNATSVRAVMTVRGALGIRRATPITSRAQIDATLRPDGSGCSLVGEVVADRVRDVLSMSPLLGFIGFGATAIVTSLAHFKLAAIAVAAVGVGLMVGIGAQTASQLAAKSNAVANRIVVAFENAIGGPRPANLAAGIAPQAPPTTPGSNFPMGDPPLAAGGVGRGGASAGEVWARQDFTSDFLRDGDALDEAEDRLFDAFGDRDDPDSR